MAENKKMKLCCPVCKGEGAEKYTPFCSQRCADVDLSKWLGGGYRIPTNEQPIGIADDDEIL